MPKSDAGQRTIPIGLNLVNTLREWQLACPRPFTEQKNADGNRVREAAKPEHLVFPNAKATSSGTPISSSAD